MAPAKSTPKASKSNDLLNYRLEQLEGKVDSIDRKIDNFEHISKADLIEFRNTILERFNEKNAQMQSDIDGKADLKDVQDLKALVKWGATFMTTVISALVIYYLTSGKT